MRAQAFRHVIVRPHERQTFDGIALVGIPFAIAPTYPASVNRTYPGGLMTRVKSQVMGPQVRHAVSLVTEVCVDEVEAPARRSDASVPSSS